MGVAHNPFLMPARILATYLAYMWQISCLDMRHLAYIYGRLLPEKAQQGAGFCTLSTLRLPYINEILT